MVLEGLDTKYTNFIEIEGINRDICKTRIIKSNECNNKCRSTETILNRGEVVYQSKDIKAKRAALLFFCGILVLIIMIQLKNGR